MTPARLKQLARKLERTNMLHPPEIRELVEAVQEQERQLRALKGKTDRKGVV